MKSQLNTVRSTGQQTIETTRTLLDTEAQQLAKRCNTLEVFSMAQFTRLDQIMEAVDGLVQQSVEMLQAVNTRQYAVRKQ
jgi:hypothetical protein